MSNPFKAIGKVFKSIGKAIKNVVKGIGKVVKKLGPAVLIIGAVLTGGALLAGGFGAGGAGIFGQATTFLKGVGTTISQGFSSVFGGSGALTAAAGTGESLVGFTGGSLGAGATGSSLGGSLGAGITGAAGEGFASSLAIGGAPTSAGLGAGIGGATGANFASHLAIPAESLISVGGGMAGTANNPSLLAQAFNGTKAAWDATGGAREFVADKAGGIGQHLKDYKELYSIGSSALTGIQDEKIAEDNRDEYARQFDEKLEAETNRQGAIYGVEADGTSVGGLGEFQYTGNNPSVNPNATNERLDQVYQDAYNRTQLEDLYNQAYYRQQQA